MKCAILPVGLILSLFCNPAAKALTWEYFATGDLSLSQNPGWLADGPADSYWDTKMTGFFSYEVTGLYEADAKPTIDDVFSTAPDFFTAKVNRDDGFFIRLPLTSVDGHLISELEISWWDYNRKSATWGIMSYEFFANATDFTVQFTHPSHVGSYVYFGTHQMSGVREYAPPPTPVDDTGTTIVMTSLALLGVGAVRQRRAALISRPF